MADLLATGSNWLAGQLKNHVSQTVTYWRCSKSVSVSATLGKTPFDVYDGNTGISSRWEARDFIVDPADLVIDEETITPEVGDEIEETIDGVAFRYQVLAPMDEPCWRYMDRHRNAIRIHTKLVEV